MPNWLKKVFVVLITVFTLGTVTPPAYLITTNADAKSKSDVIEQEPITNETPPQTEDLSSRDMYSLPWHEVAATLQDNEQLSSQFVDYTVYQANYQTMEKFGPKISQKLGDDYMNQVLPKMEDVIQMLSKKMDPDDLRNLVITDRPAAGTGERIFHIYDARTKKDLVRFHVRREHPPQQGYWFSFHYHTADDNFAKHHELGRLYWDKNTPPNWMAQ
ncbi:YpjP family protein [Fictibacillus sp. Mic-4]|uniref:YpjP family protein n=1 Tax=Fictibacillus sp. Mic-4 TaxID=3132826 RepID=UPI003CEE95DC